MKKTIDVHNSMMSIASKSVESNNPFSSVANDITPQRSLLQMGQNKWNAEARESKKINSLYAE